MFARSVVLAFPFLVLVVVNALMVEGDVSPHRGDRSTIITITYWVNQSLINPRVKVYLSNYVAETNSFNSSTSNVLIDYFNVDPFNLSPITLSLNQSPSNFYRICLGLRADGKSSTYTDCDKGNQFLLVDDTPIIIKQVVQPITGVKLIVSYPRIVVVNKSFIVNASIINELPVDVNITVYSYIINHTRKISSGSWTSNAVNCYLSSFGGANLSLIVTPSYVGNFTLVVKAKYSSLTQARLPVTVISDNGRVFLNNISLLNGLTRVVASNIKSDKVNLSLIFLSNGLFVNKSFNLSSRHSREFFFNSSGFVSALLLSSNKLVDIKTLLIPDKNETIIIPNEINCSCEINNSINKSNNAALISGMSVAESKESLLYLLILITSLIGGWLVFK